MSAIKFQSQEQSFVHHQPAEYRFGMREEHNRWFPSPAPQHLEPDASPWGGGLPGARAADLTQQWEEAGNHLWTVLSREEPSDLPNGIAPHLHVCIGGSTHYATLCRRVTVMQVILRSACCPQRTRLGSRRPAAETRRLFAARPAALPLRS
ncbi:hypothetical protein GN956_G19895 [Arapaima gigas]